MPEIRVHLQFFRIHFFMDFGYVSWSQHVFGWCFGSRESQSPGPMVGGKHIIGYGLHDLGPFREKGVTMSSEKVVHSIFPKRRIVIPNSRLTLSLVARATLCVWNKCAKHALTQDLSRNNKHILLLQPQKGGVHSPKTISSLLKINGWKVNFLWERLFSEAILLGCPRNLVNGMYVITWL